MRIRQRRNSFLIQKDTKMGGRCCVQNQERESVTSLYISRRSDHRFSTEQEAKSIYAARATRGHRFGGVPTTPRGRDLFLLGLFFG